MLVSALPWLAGAAEAQPEIGPLVRGNTAFAMDLYQRLAGTEGNVFFSPHSISTALAMTYAGARGNTAAEMAATLRLPPGQQAVHPAFGALQEALGQAQRDGIRLVAANSLWPQRGYPFREDYLALLRRHYGVSVTPVDYQAAREEARATINGWVEEHTESRIRDLLAPSDLSALTRMVLVNAVYFKGSWQHAFPLGDTTDAPFHLAGGRTVQTPMMTQKLSCGYASLPMLEALELPYADGGMSMVVLLPGKEEGIAALEKALSPETLAGWLGALRNQEVQVALPRFKTTCRFRLNDVLMAMGMRDAFREADANFEGMDGRANWLYIGAAVHKAFVEVNEEGTEAAAATGVVMVARGLPARTPVFRADRPFLFLIRETRSGAILFAGRLADPTQSGE
jgi:serpin B